MTIRHFTKRYIDWVIRLGRVKFSILGVLAIAIFALITQIILSVCFMGGVHWPAIIRSIVFGLLTAPFVVYFFTLLVERLERSRLDLERIVGSLRQEVSDRILAEKRLSEALAELERNNQDKSTLMATISHELRTPLNGIIGLSRILLDDRLTETQRNYLKTINMSAISLGHIFSDMIDLQKIDANSIQLHQKETDFLTFLNDISNFGMLMAQQRKLDFYLKQTTELPNWVMLDTARLSQILWNLINNAVKFTQEGNVSLEVKQTTKNEIIFIVTDTGIGIDTEDAKNIFTMYYQAKSSNYNPTGSGIGLAISKTIANLMGGDLTVSSKLGKGSVFTLTIQAETITKPFDCLTHIPANLKILLVEDIEVNIVVAKSMLEKLNYHVDVAMTGKEAIQLFEQNQYDLILLDIQLPDISGFEIAQYLRKKYEDGDYDYLPPLVALTANIIQDKQNYLDNGMDDVLRKPLAIEELTYCLLNYFEPEVMVNLNPKLKIDSNNVESLENNEEAINKQQIIDETMLQDLVELLGINLVKQNLHLFQETMPTYLDELNQNLQAYEAQGEQKKTPLLNSAHKLKGAFASIGLKRMQEIAALAQDENSHHWEQKIASWVQTLQQEWQQDLEVLETWLTALQTQN